MAVPLILWTPSIQSYSPETTSYMITALNFTDALTYDDNTTLGCYVFDTGAEFTKGFSPPLGYFSSQLMDRLDESLRLDIPVIPRGLISSVFFQIGPTNADHFKFQIYPISWNNLTLAWDISKTPVVLFSSLAKDRKIGNFIVDLTSTSLLELEAFNWEPFAAAAAEFEFFTTTDRQVCNVQFFGWYYC